MDRKTLVILAGGRNPERDASMESARVLREALAGSRWDAEIVPLDPVPTAKIEAADYALPLVSGGGVRGLLAMMDVPLLGERTAAAELAYEKPLAKRLLRDAGLPVLPHLPVSRVEIARDARGVIQRVAREVGFPCLVKPARGGGAQGVRAVHDAGLLLPALVQAATLDPHVLVEPFLDAREIEVSVVDGMASVPAELVFRAELYDGPTRATPGALELVIPAMLGNADRDRLQAMAGAACAALGIEAVGRVEFLVDRNTHAIVVNEVNAIPCFARTSPFPRIWEASGMAPRAVLDRMAAVADRRMRELFRRGQPCAPASARGAETRVAAAVAGAEAGPVGRIGAIPAG